MVVAPSLFRILFGEQWLPAVHRHFRSSASPDAENSEHVCQHRRAGHWKIWSEVWRQVVSVLLLVLAVVFFSRWGIEGAAFGVLAAQLTMNVLMHGMLRTAAGLTLGDIVVPQVPSLICAAGAATVAVWAGRALYAFERAPDAWVVLIAQVSCAAVFSLSFILLCRFAEVRSLVREVVVDLAPGLARTIKLPA